MTGRRMAALERNTKETSISLKLDIDGNRDIEVDTGIGFLDHLLASLAFHSGWDLSLSCKGDLKVDDHHTAEDCGIALGEAFASCLDGFRGITRFGSAHAPLDESLARAVADLSGRPCASISLALQRDSVGTMACENVPHVLSSFAASARITLHVDVLKGENDHHKAEAAFKAVALALKGAVVRSGSADAASTKGSLS